MLMIETIDALIKDEKKHLRKYKKYLQENDWSYIAWNGSGKPKSDTDVRKEEFNLHNNILNTILTRLKSVTKKVDGKQNVKSFKDYVKEIVSLIDLHKKRAEDYALNSDILDINKDNDLRANEIDFHQHLHRTTSKVYEDFLNLNISTDGDKINNNIEFYDNIKAPLSMHWILKELYPEINRILDEKGVNIDAPPLDNGMLINIKNPPKWNIELHYWEQEKETLIFYASEFQKIKNGINIDGIYISGWAYYHINVFVTPIPHKIWNPLKNDYDSEDKIINPPLRDSDWMLFENRALQERTKTLFMFVAATRRAAKTTAEASMLGHAATIGKKELLCAGSNAKDLGQLAKNFKTDTLYKNPAFAIYNVANDWTKRVEIGIKTKTQKTIPLSTLHIINTDGGNNKEIFAGFTPDLLVYDEILKEKFIEALEGVIPAMQGSDGMIRAFGMLSGTGGCLTAGNKVWNNRGELVNIEDLIFEDGILGFDNNNNILSKEPITYWQPPSKKQCLKITTNKGREIECSYDHPILIRETFSSGRYKNKRIFKEAVNIKIGDSLAVIDSVDIWSNKQMFDPRLIGWLVGDGTYGKKQTPCLINADTNIINYIKDNYEYSVQHKEATKDGRTLYKMRIKNITKVLKDLGIYGQTKDEKRLPDNIHSYSKESVCEFLGGYYDADGCVYVNERTEEAFVKITSANKEIIKETQLLLNKLGIHGAISYEKPNFKNIKTTRGHYNLIVKDKKSLIKFHKNIRFSIPYKQEKLEKTVLLRANKKSRVLKDEDNVRYERVKTIEFTGLKPIYNLTAGNTNTYIANGIVTHNTEKLSEDGYKVLSDPETNDVLPMQWDILERGVDEKFITWKEDKKRPFGTFIPGQCRVDMPKIKGNLADYLGVKSKALKDIEINITDWEKAKDIIEERRKKVEKDKLKYQKEVVYRPVKPSEIFMSGALNPFPVEELKRRRDELLETGNVGKKVVLTQDASGNISYELTNKDLASYPHSGGFVDAPVVLYEELPKTLPPNHLYVAGFDDYKQEESDTDSVGSFHIYKVNIGMDEWCGRIVASLATRPDPQSKMHRQIYLLQQAFNAKCFMENADDKYKQYLETKRVADRWLYESIDFKGDITQKAVSRRKFGWTPTSQNIRFLKNLAIQYTKEEFIIQDEDGNDITILGAQRINDLGLIEEMINYRDTANVDRITSFMSCLGIEYYLYTNWLLPKPDWNERRTKNQMQPQKKEISFAQKMFGSKNRSVF